MGVKAVESLIDGKTGFMVGINNDKIDLTPIDKAVKGKSEINKELIRVSDIVTV